MKLQNTSKGLCAICDANMSDHGMYTCKKCNKICALTHRSMNPDDYDTPGYLLIDIKSKCCNSDVNISGSITCSDACHEIFITEMETLYGKYKPVIDGDTGITYKVPTRYIIEHGLVQTELAKFPRWSEDSTS